MDRRLADPVAARFPLRRRGRKGLYEAALNHEVHIDRATGPSAFGHPGWDVCGGSSTVRWLADGGFGDDARFRTLREARDALAAHHAISPIPAPPPEDRVALVRVSAGHHRTRCGAWHVDRHPNSTWDVRRADSSRPPIIRKCRTLQGAARLIATIDPDTARTAPARSAAAGPGESSR